MCLCACLDMMYACLAMTCACVCACVHTRICVCVCMYVCVYVSMCVCLLEQKMMSGVLFCHISSRQGLSLNLEQDLHTVSPSEPVSVSSSTCGAGVRNQAWLLHGRWDPNPGPMFAEQCSYHFQPTPSLSILVSVLSRECFLCNSHMA